MGLWHKTLKDAKKALKRGDIESARKILEEHITTNDRVTEAFIGEVKNIMKTGNQFLRAAHLNLSGQINIDAPQNERIASAINSIDRVSEVGYANLRKDVEKFLKHIK